MSTLARRLVLGCLIPAALTPRADWHERWKHIQAAAGALCGIALNDPEMPNLRLVEDLIEEMDLAYFTICGDLGEAHDPCTEHVLAQQPELFAGLRKRVAERMTLLLAEEVEEVERAMDAIVESRK